VSEEELELLDVAMIATIEMACKICQTSDNFSIVLQCIGNAWEFLDESDWKGENVGACSSYGELARSPPGAIGNSRQEAIGGP